MDIEDQASLNDYWADGRAPATQLPAGPAPAPAAGWPSASSASGGRGGEDVDAAPGGVVEPARAVDVVLSRSKGAASAAPGAAGPGAPLPASTGPALGAAAVEERKSLRLAVGSKVKVLGGKLVGKEGVVRSAGREGLSVLLTGGAKPTYLQWGMVQTIADSAGIPSE